MAVLAALMGASLPAQAQLGEESRVDLAPAPTLEELQELDPRQYESVEVGLQIRLDAMEEAALSFGARGGLAHRFREIGQALERYQAQLDRTFNFQRLVINAPNGLLLEPPVVTEAENALLLSDRGQTAATTELILRINNPARLTTTARDWREYLLREFGEVEPPPEVLLPRNDEERELWRDWVARGWEEGIEQANEIFNEDLNRLTRDFNGMVRYRRLLAEGMITEPFTTAWNRGVTGGGEEMRVGDAGVRITAPSALNPEVDRWRPAERYD